MNGSPASSTPTAMRGASRSETPDILRDSSLLQSDESVIADQAHQTSSSKSPEKENKKVENKEEEMAERMSIDEERADREGEVAEGEGNTEVVILEDLSEDRIRKLEERRQGKVEGRMDETPIGVEIEDVKTPQSQKAKTKEEKSKKNLSRKTPEMVRDTPRKNTLRSGNSKEAEDDSGKDTESAEEIEETEEESRDSRERVRSPTLERNLKNIEEKTREIKLKGEEPTTVNIDSMETEKI